MIQKTEELAETPNFGTDAFSEVLKIVHVQGETARMITPSGPLDFAVPAGKPCVYIVEQGWLDIHLDDQTRVTLRAKQIALMLHGSAHRAVFRNPERAPLPSRLDTTEKEATNDSEIKCFCGSFTVDGDLAARLLRSLPPVIVLDDLEENPIEWVDTVCELVLGEVGATRPGASIMVSRLLDLLLVIILRRWAQSEDTLPGWLASAKDERIARAISAIHANASRAITNAELAKVAGMSVSSFTGRFKQIMRQSPGAYLRAWRLDQAAELLLHSSLQMDVIAEQVGYASKEAFSRAFNANFGMSPSAWRDLRT